MFVSVICVFASIPKIVGSQLFSDFQIEGSVFPGNSVESIQKTAERLILIEFLDWPFILLFFTNMMHNSTIPIE